LCLQKTLLKLTLNDTSTISKFPKNILLSIIQHFNLSDYYIIKLIEW
jgi:hypothetical protein